jgi:hypothetical protein
MALADRALVVGISKYPGIGDLLGPETDAQEFYDWVTSPGGGGVNKANAKLIISSLYPASGTPEGARPVVDEIHDFFTQADVIATANNDEGKGLGLRAGKRLWMFFSGHGFAPSLDMSGVLMANATTKRIFNIGAARWANRLYEGGWFDEVLLFQDACRNRIPTADLDGMFLLPRTAMLTQNRTRFLAFSARDQKLSKELPFPDGKTRGVFAQTLLDGLRGGARDPVTGAITARTLRTYLQDNMKKWLPAADLANPEIATEPDVHDFDSGLVIVPGSAPAVTAVETYPVEIALPAAGMAVVLQDGLLQQIMTDTPATAVWSIRLPRGLYRASAGQWEKTFPVTGPGNGAGGTVHVS